MILDRIFRKSKRIHRCVAILFLVYLPAGVVAQPENWNIRYYSTEDGLSSNHINSIIKDSQGIIWVGTDNGLNWFDGYTFSQLKHASGQKHVLSKIKVLSVYEDDESLLWIGTSDGLFRYDPSEPVDSIRQFRYRDHVSDRSIPLPQPVNRICEDKNGVLWMNTADTDDGIRPDLLTFDPSAEKFTLLNDLNVIGEDLRVLDGNEIVVDIYADRNKTIWLSTYNGLYKYIDSLNAFMNYIPYPKNLLPQINILLLAYEDSFGNFWASDVFGLLEFDRENEKFGEPVILHEQVGLYRNQASVYAISEDADGYLWMRVNEVLMRVLNVPGKNNKLVIMDSWMPDAGNLASIMQRMTLLVENPQSVWMTVANRGLCQISLYRNKFRIIEPNSLGINYSAQANYVTALYADSLNNLWLSTSISGPAKYNLINRETERSRMMPFNMINEIDVDAEGNIWFVSRYGIHHRTEPGQQNIERLITYAPDSARPSSLTERMETGQYGKATVSPLQHEHVLHMDNQGNLWFNSGKGIHDRYILETDDFIHLDHCKTDYFNNDTCIAETEGEVWFPTRQGLERVIPPFTKTAPHTFVPGHTILYTEKAGDTTSLNSSWIKAVYISKYYEPGTMWIATIGGGLNKMVKKRAEVSGAPEICFRHFTESDGLCNNNILGILEDKHGNLWLSTLNGLSKFDPREECFTNFYEEDGLPSNQFSWAKPSMGVNGQMFFPHACGVIVFDPDSIQSNKEIPEICITKFWINNAPVFPGSSSPLKKDIRYVNEIELDYNQNFLSFEFAALSFEVPERNQYRYMMEGLDRGWVHAGNRRFADYTDLKPGAYTFKVTGSNNNGVWNDNGRLLQITIHRPPWYSWWAFLTYGLLLAGLIMWFRILLLKHTRTMRALEIERIDKEKVLEVDRLKSRFFMNISHEFRTPLSLITGLVGSALQNRGEQVHIDRGEVEMVNRNAKRLHELINQLMDISKLESGTDSLKVEEGNLGDFVQWVFSNFESLAESRNIHYQLALPDAGMISWFDTDKVEKILINLINNAFKFTDSGGRIMLTLRYLEDSASEQLKVAELTVSDSGIGIPPDKIDRIFDRFYQADASDTRSHEGTGIGLALVKEIVELYRGDIAVESQYGRGTTFRVTIPVSKAHFRNDERFVSEMHADVIGSVVTGHEQVKPAEVGGISQEASSAGNTAPCILIVEDNPDLRTFIAALLEAEYHILTAENGRSGLELAVKYLPDLVISDLMMPVMGGKEMTAKMKKDTTTNHIPVIMLTAKADKQSKLEGLELGADDYLIKPFDKEELLVRVRNLIRQRELLRAKFAHHFLDEKNEEKNAIHFRVLRGILDAIDRHIEDPEFNLSSFGRELGMTRSQLFRKIHSTAGTTPNELLRIVRMKRAAQLFRSRDMNVTQVMYEVGMRSPSHFAKSFKTYFGVNPAEYIGRNREG